MLRYALVGALVYGTILWMEPAETTQRILLGHNDFVQLYAGARLAGTPDLYSHEAVKQIQREVAGIESDSSYIRAPFYAALLRPLAFLPYKSAYWLFQAASLASFLIFLCMYVPGCRELAAFASLSIPLFATITNAQDTAIMLALAGLSVALARRNLDFLAGLVLALCSIKINLFMLVPLAILIQRRYRILYGGLTGGAILAALSFAVGGADWPQRFLGAAVSDPNPHPEFTPNLHGLLLSLGQSDLMLELLLGAMVAAGVAYVAARIQDYETVFGLSLIGSLLVSYHSFTQDCILLLLALALLLRNPISKRIGELMELAASPIPYFCMLAGAPFNILLPGLLMIILGISVAGSPARERFELSSANPLGA